MNNSKRIHIIEKAIEAGTKFFIRQGEIAVKSGKMTDLMKAHDILFRVSDLQYHLDYLTGKRKTNENNTKSASIQ